MRGKHSNIMNIYMYIFGPYPLEADWLVFIIGPVIDFFLRTFPPSATCTMIVLCAWNYFVVSYVALKRLLVLIAGVWSFVNKQDQNLKKKMYIPLFYIALLRPSTLHTTEGRKLNFTNSTWKKYILVQFGEIQREFPFSGMYTLFYSSRHFVQMLR